MPTQLALKFDDVPITCPIQKKYHAIAPCLAGTQTPEAQAKALNVGYSTITRWLREFREKGMPSLFPATEYPREPYTPERAIVRLIYAKCQVPKAGDRELARIVHAATGHSLHNETVKALLKRYFFWQYSEFREAVRYPVPPEPEQQRLEMRRLKEQGWSEKHIAVLLRCTPRTVNKWLRRLRQAEAEADAALKSPLPWHQDQSRAPHHTRHGRLSLSQFTPCSGYKEIRLCRLVSDQRVFGKGIRHLSRLDHTQEDQCAQSPDSSGSATSCRCR
jgi:transposase